MKKIKIYSELLWLLSMAFISFSVAMTAASDFGLSMKGAPPYILSLKLGFLTFGQCEYIIQALLFCILCLLMGRIKPLYFCAFLTSFIYGLMLDGWRLLIPMFNPSITAPGSMSLGLRIVYYVSGLVILSLGVAMGIRSYIYPQVYDFLIKAVAQRYGVSKDKLRICLDLCFLLLGCLMTLLFFGSFRGIGIGTVITALTNGLIVGFFGCMMDKYWQVVPLCPALEKRFAI